MSFYLGLLLLLVAQKGWAQEFHTWQEAPGAPQFLVFSKDDPKTSFRSYLDKLSKLPEVAENFSSISERGKYSNLDLSRNGTRVNVAVVANSPKDLRDSPRMRRISNILRSMGAEPYIVPPAYDLSLNTPQAEAYREFIAKEIDLLFLMGGNDIDPALYGQKNRSSHFIQPAIDLAEFLLVKAYRKLNLGMCFGICRGHEMLAIAEGHALYQDISEIKGESASRHVNAKGTSPSESQTWHTIDITGPLALRFFGKSKILVNSIHHQAAALVEGIPIIVAGKDGKVIEIIESIDGRILSTQFHLEFPEEISGNRAFSNMGYRVLKKVVAYARLIRQKRNSVGLKCRQIVGF